MVNTTDFKPEELGISIANGKLLMHEGVDRIEMIFRRQKSLMRKYHDVYKSTGFEELSPNYPVDIDTPRGQHVVKYNLYCVFEELGEAIDAIGHEEHFVEELIDGLHFLTEACIYAGFQPWKITESEYTLAELGLAQAVVSGTQCRLEEIEEAVSEQRIHSAFVYLWEQLGMAGNCLKQKPWKQDHKLTDVKAFHLRLQRTWHAYVSLLKSYGVSPDAIVIGYYQKSAVNEFRQRSNY